MTTYIAETDESRDVVAVWVIEKSARSPRVFDPEKHIFDDTSRAEFSGAPRDEIMRRMSRAKAKKW